MRSDFVLAALQQALATRSVQETIFHEAVRGQRLLSTLESTH